MVPVIGGRRVQLSRRFKSEIPWSNNKNKSTGPRDSIMGSGCVELRESNLEISWAKNLVVVVGYFKKNSQNQFQICSHDRLGIRRTKYD
jgi:hypothetical protein